MKPRAIPRSEYLIDHHHVIFDPGADWQCVCAEFKSLDDCRHVRESQGRHAAQVAIARRIGSPLGNHGMDSRESSRAREATLPTVGPPPRGSGLR